MKKFLALFLTTALVLGIAVPVSANGQTEYNSKASNPYNGYNSHNGYDNNNGNNGYNNYSAYDHNNIYDSNENSYVNVIPIKSSATSTALGYIGEITQADGNYKIEITDHDGAVKTVISVPAQNAIVLDSATGKPANLHDHGDSKVHITYDPQTKTALVVAINVEDMNIPSLHTIEEIKRYEDKLLLTVDNGGIIITINEDTELLPWLTRQIITKNEFKVGDKVLLWYTIIAMSYPAQTTANRAIRLIPAQQKNGASYNNESNNDYGYGYDYPNYTTEARYLEGEIVHAGVYLYPVRVNAYAANFHVEWNEELTRAEFTKGDTLITLEPNVAVFYVNGVRYVMIAPSLLNNGRLFAPVDFFEHLQ